MLFVETPVVATQSAMETAGTAATGGALAAGGPVLAAVVPMGTEETSAMIAAAIAAHAADFTAMTGVGVVQRGLFAAQVGSSAALYAASNALNAASLAL